MNEDQITQLIATAAIAASTRADINSRYDAAVDHRSEIRMFVQCAAVDWISELYRQQRTNGMSIAFTVDVQASKLGKINEIWPRCAIQTTVGCK